MSPRPLISAGTQGIFPESRTRLASGTRLQRADRSRTSRRWLGGTPTMSLLGGGRRTCMCTCMIHTHNKHVCFLCARCAHHDTPHSLHVPCHFTRISEVTSVNRYVLTPLVKIDAATTLGVVLSFAAFPTSRRQIISCMHVLLPLCT